MTAASTKALPESSTTRANSRFRGDRVQVQVNLAFRQQKCGLSCYVERYGRSNRGNHQFRAANRFRKILARLYVRFAGFGQHCRTRRLGIQQDVVHRDRHAGRRQVLPENSPSLSKTNERYMRKFVVCHCGSAPIQSTRRP
jgi:hypothetical protein